MSTVFNLQVLSSDCFISGTVRMPDLTEVGPRSLLLYYERGPVNTAAVMFMLPPLSDHILQFLHWFGLFFLDKTSY